MNWTPVRTRWTRRCVQQVVDKRVKCVWVNILGRVDTEGAADRAKWWTLVHALYKKCHPQDLSISPTVTAQLYTNYLINFKITTFVFIQLQLLVMDFGTFGSHFCCRHHYRTRPPMGPLMCLNHALF